MQLTLARHSITGIRFGVPTRLDGTVLQIDRAELSRLLLNDESLTQVDIEIVAPGESCRAGPVFDIVEPRAKAPGSSPDWPGILSEPFTAGFGTTHVLEGAAVTVLREGSPNDSRGNLGFVLVMSGDPAAGTIYSLLHHVILIPRTRPELPRYGQQKAYRRISLLASVYLARVAFRETPGSVETFGSVGAVGGNVPGVPRVAYVGQIFSRQRKPEPDEQILYGADTDGMLPVLLHPDEWLDGALVPSYHTSKGGAETYVYQNHPVIIELYRRHAAGEINFVGTVATIASANNFDRERNCRFAANLVKWTLQADAAVLTKFGGGVPHTDLSETARLLETAGVKTAVQVTDEARDGRMESALLFNFPEVNAIVCIGGNHMAWDVPAVDRALAATAETAEQLRGPLSLPAHNVIGVANQQGVSRLRATVY
jgi:glycine reductase